ncbi:hypothetical protein UZZ22_24960, partial [Escherichia coli]|nr:hypothetical protein [Escherichia coli]
AFYQADKVAVTLTLVNVGDVALFGLVIDRVSTLILFVLVFIGAMAGLVLSSTLLGQLLFFEITGGCSWALINY